MSCLIRTTTIVINTARRTHSADDTSADGTRVILNTQALDAYSENQQCPQGTSIRLALKDQFSRDEVFQYLRSSFLFPSVSIFFFNLSAISEMVTLAKSVGIPAGAINFDAGSDSLWRQATDGLQACTDVYTRLSKAHKARKRIDVSSFWKGFSVTRPGDVVSAMPTTPLFLFLNGDFRIRSASTSFATKRAERICPVVTVWIPVRVVNREYGIDWGSLHGFIVHGGVVKRLVVSYTGLADEFENEELVGTYGEEELEEDWEDNVSALDIGDGNVDLVDLVRWRGKTRGRRPTVPERDVEEEADVHRLLAARDRIVVLDAQGESKDFIDRSDEYVSAPHLRKIQRSSSTDSVLLEEEFRRWFKGLDNNVYQDGLLLPMRGWAIAPIGACRSRCNLTGSSRFELNASRNMVNESPTLLKLWAEEIGTKVQTAIISTVTDALNKSHLEFDSQSLVSSSGGNEADDFLVAHTSRVLMEIVGPKRQGSSVFPNV